MIRRKSARASPSAKTSNPTTADHQYRHFHDTNTPTGSMSIPTPFSSTHHHRRARRRPELRDPLAHGGPVTATYVVLKPYRPQPALSQRAETGLGIVWALHHANNEFSMWPLSRAAAFPVRRTVRRRGACRGYLPGPQPAVHSLRLFSNSHYLDPPPDSGRTEAAADSTPGWW